MSMRWLALGLALPVALGGGFLLNAAIAQQVAPESKERPSPSLNFPDRDIFPQATPASPPKPSPVEPCSRPMVVRSVSLTAPPPSPATPLASELPATIWTTLQGPYGTTAWGNAQPDKAFAHTFQWNPPCKTGCRMGGTLTFTYRNNLPATSNTASDAGNDKYYVYNGGTLFQSGSLYTSASPAGQTFTKTLTLSPAEVANNKVTLVVQDDTAVVNAKLDLKYCCCECRFPIE